MSSQEILPGQLCVLTCHTNLWDGTDRRVGHLALWEGDLFIVIRLFFLDRPDCAGGYDTGVTSTGEVGVVWVPHLIDMSAKSPSG